MSATATQVGNAGEAAPSILGSQGGWSDQAVLQTLGIALTLGGLLLLAAAGQLMGDAIPPTLNIATSAMVAVGVGVAFTVTGLVYLFAVRDHVDSKLGPEGLCVTCNPETGTAEWLKPANIESALLRPWPLSPWVKTKRYYELELKVREGSLQVDDTFLIHVFPDIGAFVERLREALGSRLEVKGIAEIARA